VRFVGYLAAALVLALVSVPAWADHPGGLRSEGWSPLTAALVFGGLALIAGAIVVVVVAILTRQEDTSSE
jgi:ABC-type phosphate transport system permease subunit